MKIVTFDESFQKDFKILNEEWIVEYFYIEENDKKALDYPQQNIIEKGGFIRLAELDGEIVGTCALIKVSETVYELAKMGVTKKARGKKIGDRLMAAMLQIAREQNCKKVLIYTNSVLTPAIKLYEKYGFQHVDMKEEKNYYARGDVKMELDL